MDDEPSDNVRTAIGVSVGLTSGIVILYYFVRLCRAIARFPKSDSEEALPAYRPPSIPPGTDGSYSHNENTYNNPSAGGHNMSGNNALPSLTDEFHDLRREQVPVNIPTLPSPVYSRPARDSGYYHHGEMTQIGDSSTTLSGTFAAKVISPHDWIKKTSKQFIYSNPTASH
ncbi:hypothetical protein FBU30_006140 [Linnemannia zychae]|nr:hypothetical protein FBU30_006140 [Linnemannia zychae]